MRFSDMMGSGDDKSSKRSTPSESEALIADALAPYVGRGAANVAAAAVEPVAPDDPEVPDAAEADEFEVAPTAVTPVAPPAPVVPVVPVAPPAPPAPPAAVELPSVAPRDPIAATIADFAPISDDLLPRRR
jgi:hypothetical protein